MYQSYIAANYTPGFIHVQYKKLVKDLLNYKK